MNIYNGVYYKVSIDTCIGRALNMGGGVVKVQKIAAVQLVAITVDL